MIDQALALADILAQQNAGGAAVAGFGFHVLLLHEFCDSAVSGHDGVLDLDARGRGDEGAGGRSQQNHVGAHRGAAPLDRGGRVLLRPPSRTQAKICPVNANLHLGKASSPGLAAGAADSLGRSAVCAGRPGVRPSRNGAGFRSRDRQEALFLP